MRFVNAIQKRMAGDALKDLAQSVLRNAKAETLLKGFGGLFEHDDFAAVANARYVGSRAVDGECALGDDEEIGCSRTGNGREHLNTERVALRLAVAESGGRLQLVTPGRGGSELDGDALLCTWCDAHV